MGVDTLNTDYTNNQDDWRLTRALLEGDRAVKALGVEVVPAFASMYTSGTLDQTKYKAFLKQAVLSEYAQKILTNANGLLYAKQPVITVPTALNPTIEDITLSGVSLMDIMKDGTGEVISVGRVCYLVDIASDTRSDEDKQKSIFTSRPYAKEYQTESVTKWKYETIDGVQVLSLVVLKESKDVWTDEFTNESETIYRVLRLTNNIYTQQVYEQDSDGNFQGGEIITPLNAGNPLNEIPFIGITPTVGTIETAKAPLIPVVNLNLYHFMRSVDKGYQLHQMAAGTIVIGGVDDFKD